MRIRWRNFELPSKVQPDGETLTSEYGRFIVEPFERGFGHTIGNGLRRVLLSSIEGTAVTAVRIEGAEHEFASLEGVYEDVTDIVLNIKKLRIRYGGRDKITCKIERDKTPNVKSLRSSGLGHAFTRLVVEAPVGRIWLQSTQVPGSAFHILLPLPPPATSVARANAGFGAAT